MTNAKRAKKSETRNPNANRISHSSLVTPSSFGIRHSSFFGFFCRNNIFKQVRSVLRREAGFEAFRHKGLAKAAAALHVGAHDHCVFAEGLAHGEASGAFVGDYSDLALAIFRFDFKRKVL